MRLSLVCGSLQGGGAERVMTHLANHWTGLPATVNMILRTDTPDQPPYYHLAPQIQLSRLGPAHASSGALDAALANLRRIWRLRQEMRKTDAQVVISFGPYTNVLATLAAQGIGAKVVISERSSIHPVPVSWRLLNRVAYALADKIVLQTDRALQAFPSPFRGKAVVLPNPVFIPSEPSASIDASCVIAAGRLVSAKGFDLLLEAFAMVAPSHPTWSLVIWGTGPERGRLESLCARLGLGDRVRLPGQTAKPGAWARSAGSIFVLPSRREGFPNALCEAMATGHAVVAADCRFGPRELVADGENGLLVPAGDARALAQALARLMGDPDLRRRFGAAARQSIGRFAADNVLRDWTELVRGLVRPQ